jgi:hypothetical protein
MRGAVAAVAVVGETAGKLKAALKAATRSHSAGETWLQRLIILRLCERASLRGPAYWERHYSGLTPEERAQRRVTRSIRRSTAAGVTAAALATSGELVSLLTEWQSLPIGALLGAGGIAAETLYTTVLRVDLAWDLASIYGVPLHLDDVGDLSTLLGISVGVDPLENSANGRRPRHIHSMLRSMNGGEFAHDVGNRLIQASVLRNILPVVGIAVSAAWNLRTFKRFAEHVDRHMRHRRAIVRACAELSLAGLADVELLVHGAWLLATIDGELRPEEALALAKIVDAIAEPQRHYLKTKTFDDDEEGWFERLACADVRLHEPLLRMLLIVASADHVIDEAERRFLRRVGHVMTRSSSSRPSTAATGNTLLCDDDL